MSGSGGDWAERCGPRSLEAGGRHVYNRGVTGRVSDAADRKAAAHARAVADRQSVWTEIMRQIHLRASSLTAAAAMMSTISAGAQAPTPRARLAAVTTLNCTFTSVATGTWQKDGTAAVETGPSTLKVVFSNINIDEGTADLEGSFGGSYFISVRHATDYLHLIQMHGSGPLYTTTVHARESREGRLIAVHTRHEYTEVRLANFTSRPEMYIGDCSLG